MQHVHELEGFKTLVEWFRTIMKDGGYLDVIVGMESTGHYWLNLVHYLRVEKIACGVVSPLHVKKSKELDDNSPTKNEIKNAKVVAQLSKTEDTLYRIFHRGSMQNSVKR